VTDDDLARCRRFKQITHCHRVNKSDPGIPRNWYRVAQTECGEHLRPPKPALVAYPWATVSPGACKPPSYSKLGLFWHNLTRTIFNYIFIVIIIINIFNVALTMLIIVRTTGVQTVVTNVTNGNSNTRVIWWCIRKNGKTERSRVVVWKPRVTAQMRRGEAGRSRRWHQKPKTPARRLLCI